MTDIKLLRKGLDLTRQELDTMAKISRIWRVRMTMAEWGLVTLNPDEESILRLALAYIMHCRSIRLAQKVGQGAINPVEMTWDEYVREHSGEDRPEKQMEVIVVNVDLSEQDGRLLFPLSDPIPWDIVLDRTAAGILASYPTVLESLIDNIRSAVAAASRAR